jgi:transposase
MVEKQGMAKRRFHLTAEQSAELWQVYHEAEDPQEQRRWQAVRLYGEDWAVSAIQAVTGYSATSLYRWASQYRAGGAAALRSQWHGGNRARLTEAQRTAIQTLVQQATPDQFLGSHQRRHDSPFWTVEDLALLVEQRYGVVWHSRTSYRSLLHECGLSVQRVSKRFRSRPSDHAIAEVSARLEKK